MNVLRIKDWDVHFENNRTRELKRMDWVPMPNKMDGDGYTELVDHPDGAAHFGAWCAIVEVASKCATRGTLLRTIPQEGATSSAESRTHLRGGSVPHDSASLSRLTRLPRAVFDEVIPRLLAIGWLESVTIENKEVTSIPQEGAGIPQEGAVSRVRAGARAGTERNGTERESTTPASPALSGEDADGVQAAVVEIWFAGGVASTHRAWVIKLVSSFRELKATPDEIRRRHAEYRRKHPNWESTPDALVKWWHDCASQSMKPTADAAAEERSRKRWEAHEARKSKAGAA